MRVRPHAPHARRRAGEAFRSAAAAAGYQLEHIPAPPRGTGPDELLKQLKTAVSGAHRRTQSGSGGGLEFSCGFELPGPLLAFTAITDGHDGVCVSLVCH